MKVFKFGGASVKDAAGVKNLQHILDLYTGEQLVVVISAIGKTTNHMEKLLDAYLADSETVWTLFDELKQKHYTIAQELTADAKVITDKLDEVKSFILNDLERGGTCFPGIGLYQGQERRMIYVTLDRSDLVKLKSNLRTLDPNAFVNVIESSEIMGYGFKALPEE